MRKLSRGVFTPYLRPTMEIIIRAAITEMIETPIMIQDWKSNILRIFVAGESFPGGLDIQ